MSNVNHITVLNAQLMDTFNNSDIVMYQILWYPFILTPLESVNSLQSKSDILLVDRNTT